MKKLVVYFSRVGENIINGEKKVITKGNTEVVAEKIAKLTEAELFQIVPSTPYPETYVECNNLSRVENETNKCADILNMPANLDDFDTVYLGFPIWHKSAPAIVFKFVRSLSMAGKTVYPFCTNDEGSFGTAELELKFFLREANLKSGLSIHGSQVYDCDAQLKDWLAK